jgi:hypothetical protein
MEAGIVTRTRRHQAEPSFELQMALLCGPNEWDGAGLTDEDLELAWRIHGTKIMEDQHRDGSRPWAWWTFEAREDPPPREPGAEEIASLSLAS